MSGPGAAAVRQLTTREQLPVFSGQSEEVIIVDFLHSRGNLQHLIAVPDTNTKNGRLVARSQTSGFGQIYSEPVASALVAAGHFR